MPTSIDKGNVIRLDSYRCILHNQSPDRWKQNNQKEIPDNVIIYADHISFLEFQDVAVDLELLLDTGMDLPEERVNYMLSVGYSLIGCGDIPYDMKRFIKEQMESIVNECCLNEE